VSVMMTAYERFDSVEHKNYVFLNVNAVLCKQL
jgi:hypothetical protein